MDALTAIARRRSTRQFKAVAVPRDILEKIVDAGRLAATARNIQPWEFVVVTSAEIREQLADIAEYGKFIAHAPACIAVLCLDTKYYLEDGSAATENMLVAAEALGVQTCWVAGDKKSYAGEVARLLGAPENYKLVSLVALGYADKPTLRPAKRPLSEVLHWEKFQGSRLPRRSKKS
jgi:nitroreductase